MEQYVVSARKYRPSTFASVVGQKALASTLKNAVLTGRLASSYLFCGSRGVGKTTCARIFAKAINCEHLTPDGEPCNECDSCRAFNNNSSLNILEMDAASNNSVEDIRELTKQTQVPPSSGRYRVFIVDEVHMLSSAAFNAFLKTLEEPPSYVVFILATTEKHKIIPTILSRCQIYDFHRISARDMVDHMLYVASQEGISAEPQALNIIAQKADGAMRDALSIFDQIAASTRGNITYQATLDNLNMLDARYYSRLLDCFLEGRVLDTWMIYKEIRDKGFDSLFFINGLGEYFRNLFAASNPDTIKLIEATDEIRNTLAADASRCTAAFLLRAMNLCNDADLNYRVSSGKQFLIELTLAKICQLLSPSPDNGGEGEGHLKPVATAPATAAPTTPIAQRTPNHEQKPALAPKQAVAPRPMPKSAPAIPRPVVKTAAPHMPRTTLRVPGISINTSLSAGHTPVASDHKADSARNEAYTRQQLDDAWQNFINAHPKDHVLINAMKSAPPQPVDGATHKYRVIVLNTFQQTELNRVLPELTEFLRNALSNNTIELSVDVNEDARPRHTLNDRELLSSMIETNPILAKFISEFQLKL